MKRRRYPTGISEAYDSTYVRLKNASVILTDDDLITNARTTFLDKAGLVTARYKYVGDENGKYLHANYFYTALIPDLKQRIEELEDNFKYDQEELENQGIEPPSIMPPAMLEKKHRLEATLDIYEEELVKIEEALKEIKEEQYKESSKYVLKYGLLQEGQLRRGELVELDGQTVIKHNGVLLIKDKRSPYNGMSVMDYRKMAAKWVKDKAQRDLEELERMQAAARKKGGPIPSQYISVFTKGTLPAWPEGIKNHLAE